MADMRFTSLIAVLVLFLLLPLGCSDDDTDSNPVLPGGDGESEETSDGNLFDTVWWDTPDEQPITDLLRTSAFFASKPWLITEMSSWFEENEHETPGEEPIDAGWLGYYAAGNGQSFAFVGTFFPRNTIHGLIGPEFQKHNGGFFSDFSAYLQKDGGRLEWSREWIWKLREAEIPVTTMQVHGARVELDTLTFAPISDDPGHERSTIVQLLNVRNSGSGKAEGISLRVQSYSPADKLEGDYLEQERDDHLMRVSPLSEGWSVIESDSRNVNPAFVSSEFDLEAGQERQFVMVYEFVMDTETPGAGKTAVESEGWETLLDETADWWRNWHRSGLQIRTPDRRVNDLIEGLKSTVRVQICKNGALTVMSHYTSTWIRDSFGPSRMLLRFGYPELAWGISDYYFGVSSVEGSIGNAKDVDVELPDPLPTVDWMDKIPFGQSRLRGEGPSYIPLMHASLWRYTGLGNILAERWDYLMHTLKGQTITEDGLMYFSGDETFRPILALNLEMNIEYKWEYLTYSANSAFLFVAACEKLAGYAGEYGLETDDISWLTEKAEEVREATENLYWLEAEGRYSPFYHSDAPETQESGDPGNPTEPDLHCAEDVNTKPIWTGYLDRDEEKARSNLQSCMDQILTETGVLQNRPSVSQRVLGYEIGDGCYTGMAPAYFLYNLAELNMPEAEKAFDAVGTLYISPSGNLPEVGLYIEPGRALSPLYFRAGREGEIWARFREWEGAIAAEALMHYLIGFEADVNKGWIKLAPRLVHDSAWIEAEGLAYLGNRLSMRYEESDGGYLLSITADDDPATYGLKKYLLRLTVPLSQITEVAIDGRTLSPDGYEVIAPYDGASELKLSTDAKQGLFELSIK